MRCMNTPARYGIFFRSICGLSSVQPQIPVAIPTLLLYVRYTPLSGTVHRGPRRDFRHIRESGILLHSHRTPRHHNQCTQHHKISTKQTLKPTHSLTRRTLLTGARPAHAPFRLRRSSAAIAISLAPFWVTFLATAWIEKAASQALAPAWGSFRGGCSFRP